MPFNKSMISQFTPHNIHTFTSVHHVVVITLHLYFVIINRKCYKLGSNAWLCLSIFCTEALICIKFGHGMFPKPTPPEVFWPWVIVIVVGGIAMTIYFATKADTTAAVVNSRGSNNNNTNAKVQSSVSTAVSSKRHRKRRRKAKNAATSNGDQNGLQEVVKK